MNNNQLIRCAFVLCICCFICQMAIAQAVDRETIRQRIQDYKEDSRGPYYLIKWFCDDGSIIGAKEDCPEPGGVQHAQYKREIVNLGRTNHVFLGQILTGTSRRQFWDSDNNHSRIKQYSLEKYLKAIDNGWILRKAQFYRGAFQVEDEEEWGLEFLTWLMGKTQSLKDDFFLIRQSAKDIPHRGDTDLGQRIRSYSKYIADEYPDFEGIRIKIHSQPDRSDIRSVQDFGHVHFEKLDPNFRPASYAGRSC